MSNLEEFNSERSLMRVTTDRIPSSSNLQKDVAIPLGVIVKPYGEPTTVIFIGLTYFKGRGDSINIIWL